MDDDPTPSGEQPGPLRSRRTTRDELILLLFIIVFFGSTFTWVMVHSYH